MEDRHVGVGCRFVVVALVVAWAGWAGGWVGAQGAKPEGGAGGGGGEVAAVFLTEDDLHLPDAGLSRNLVENPSFAGGLAKWGWGVTGVARPAGGEAGWRADGGVGREDRSSARYDVVPGEGPSMLSTLPIAAEAGETYTLSFYAKSDAPGQSLRVWAQTSRWGVFPLNTHVELGERWERFSFELVVPQSFFRVSFGHNWQDRKRPDRQADGSRIWLDDVQIERGATASEFTQKPVVAFSSTGQINESFPAGPGAKVVRAEVVNTTGNPRSVRGQVVIADLRRRPLLRESFEALLPAHGRRSVEIDLQPLGHRGLMRVVMSVESEGFTEESFGRVGIYEPITDPGRVIYAAGFNPEWPWHQGGPPGYTSEEELRRLRGFMRDVGQWGSLSFTPPEDPGLIGELVGEGWTHVFSISSGPENPPAMRQRLIQKSPRPTAEQWEAYGRAVRERAERYPGQKIWKTINEPGYGGSDWTLEDYLQATRILYQEIKRVNPEAIVLSPDMATAAAHRRKWLDRFLTAGGGEVVDAIAIHTYRDRPEDPSLHDDIVALLELREKHGLDDQPLFFTEGEGRWDYTVEDVSTPFRKRGMAPHLAWGEWRLKWLTLDVGQDELTAAAIHTRTLIACFRHASHVAMYLSWNTDFVDGQPRASMFAVNTLYALLRHAEFVEALPIGPECSAYLFKTSRGEPIVVAWCHALEVDLRQRPGPTLSLPESHGLKVLDMMGNPQTADREVAEFRLSGRPIYFLGGDIEVPRMRELFAEVGDK